MKLIVLMSTYNGEKYLRQQLDSLLNQDLRPDLIYIRDDGSKDEESIIRLFKSYSKIEKSQQAVYYGDLFMGMDISSQNKFQNVIKDIENEKIKLNSLQNIWRNRI